MSQFDWNDLRYFLAVARNRRLTSAAKKLKTDHATVSRRITALETALQTKLFDRSPQGYALTAQGEKLLAKAEAMEEQALKISSKIGGSDVALSGTVRIGCFEGLAKIFLAPRLPKLAKRFPDLDVELFPLLLRTSPLNRDIDIVITSIQDKNPKISSELFATIKLNLYASASYIEHSPSINNIADLKNHVAITYPEHPLIQHSLDALYQLCTRESIQLRSASIFTLVEIALSGGGLCLIPNYVADTEPKLIQLFPNEISVSIQLWLSVLEAQKNIARIQSVIKFLNREVRSPSARSILMPP